MAGYSTIEWTNATWNPVTGCSRVSPGCENCYAERMAKRLRAMGQNRYRNGFNVTLQSDILDLPLSWRRPCRILVNSMSDLFHPDVPQDFIHRVFNMMGLAHWHVFQILTKRSDRLLDLSDSLPWHNNIWVGVSVENADFTYRVRHLQKVKSVVRFVSAEPLLGPINRLPLAGIDWIIVGGESGPKARPMNGEWVRSILRQCIQRDIPFFFKHWGGTRKSGSGRLFDGRLWNDFPQRKTNIAS